MPTPRRSRATLLLAALFVVPACSSGRAAATSTTGTGGSGPDAGAGGSAPPPGDAGPSDAPASDDAASDASPRDAGPHDAAAITGKKGVGLGPGAGATQLLELGVDWYYDWSTTSGTATQVPFVPLIFSPGDDTKPISGPIVLGFNEPEAYAAAHGRHRARKPLARAAPDDQRGRPVIRFQRPRHSGGA